jgi:protein SCO1/2
MNALRFIFVKCPRWFAAALLLAAIAVPARASSDDFLPPMATDHIPLQYQNVGVVEHLDRQLPMDATFFNENGKATTLRKIMTDGHPVLLQLGYLECPMLCDTISHSLVDAAKQSNLEVGKDFDFVFISIDPDETPTLATLKRNNYAAAYGKAGQLEGFHVLVGRPNEIAMMANTVGFGFKPAANGQFAHPAVAMVITPDGKISRYLYGVSFTPQLLKQAISDASQHKYVNSIEVAILICLRLDPNAKNLAWAMNLMRAGGILAMLALGGAIFWMVRYQRSLGDIPLPESDGNSPNGNENRN